MQLWAQMVPVMKGRGFFSVMSRRAEAYAPFRHSSIYSGMSWWMGQPPLQGAVKQSSRGTLSYSLRRGRGLMAFTWYLSDRAARERASMPTTSTPVKGLKSGASSVSPSWVNRW